MLQSSQDATLLGVPISYFTTHETFDSLAEYWSDLAYGLNWNQVFGLPAWLKTWWQEFGDDNELHLIAVRQGEKVIGVAPLRIRDGRASFIGSTDICDYLDFIIAPGKEIDFFTVLLDDLKKRGINRLDLVSLRSDSTVLTHLVDIAQKRHYLIDCQQDDVSVEMNLPDSWDKYLALLEKKQRHEIRRKLRRLQEAGVVDYCCLQAGRDTSDSMDTFLRLFSLSRQEKAKFMTAQMEAFFRSMSDAMARIGLLSFGILKLDGVIMAIVIVFDYNGTVYLYNSAYDPQYNSLSVGLLSKILCLKESIERGRQKWDFLKGGEAYKYRIGGEKIALYSCHITIS